MKKQLTFDEAVKLIRNKGGVYQTQVSHYDQQLMALEVCSLFGLYDFAQSLADSIRKNNG